MVTILHGNNQVASRNRLVELREEAERKESHVVNLDGKRTDFEQIKIATSTPSLLGQESRVFVEEYFSGKGGNKAVGEISGTVVFWEPREIARSHLTNLPKNWKLELFSIPRSVFQFLESLAPEKAKSNINFLHQVLSQNSPEILLPLLAWHIRQLIWVKEDSDAMNAPGWKKQKLENQAKKFKLEELYGLHEKLITLDRDIKTGSVGLPLSSSLDLVFASF